MKLGDDKVFVQGVGRIFVFGSNTVGRHGAGAAKDAWKYYGAIMGQGTGLQGHSYAIPTKDKTLHTLPLGEVKKYVDAFIGFAERNPQLNFFVTRVGCGLAGYRDQDIAPLFRGVSNNVELPHGWPELIQEA